MLASAVDSLLDVSMSVFNFFILHNSQKDPDEKFNFGRGKLEPLAAVIEGTVIIVSALFILYQAIQKILHTSKTVHINESIIVMIISVVITGGLVFFLGKIAQKTNNMVIRADALHYKTDLLTNVSVLFALLLVSFTHIEIIDPIVGVLITVYMIYSAMPIIQEGINMLLDASLDEESLQKIKDLLKNNQNISAYHFLTTRKAGSEIFISAHLVFDMDTTLYEAHIVSDTIELQLQRLFPDHDVNTIMHLDPYDDSGEESDE
jgi:ferrous-iron efflux pump FieF